VSSGGDIIFGAIVSSGGDHRGDRADIIFGAIVSSGGDIIFGSIVSSGGGDRRGFGVSFGVASAYPSARSPVRLRGVSRSKTG
jgi:hypothetical protein